MNQLFIQKLYLLAAGLFVLTASSPALAAEKEKRTVSSACVDSRAALIQCAEDEFMTHEGCRQREAHYVHCKKLIECIDVRAAMVQCRDHEALVHDGCKQTERFFMRCAPTR